MNSIKSFWQKSWWSKLIIVVVGLFIFFVILSFFSPQRQKKIDEGINVAKDTTTEPSPSPEEQIAVSEQSPQVALSPYEIMTQVGKDAAGDNSNVSVFENDDGSIDVINNIQLTPEITFGLDAATRKWVTEFLSKSYTSGLNIRYVLVTVSYLGTDIPAVRVGLGIDRAKSFSKEEWEKVLPYDLCKWLTRVQVGDSTDPGDPSFVPSNWAFAKNYECS